MSASNWHCHAATVGNKPPSPGETPDAAGSDRGSAPVEFLAFGVPGVLVLLTACQFVFAGYLDTVGYDAAVEGAEVAAYAESSDAAAVQRVRAVIGAVSGVEVRDVTVEHTVQNGTPVNTVSLALDSPMLGLGAITINQSAQAVDEPR